MDTWEPPLREVIQNTQASILPYLIHCYILGDKNHAACQFWNKFSCILITITSWKSEFRLKINIFSCKISHIKCRTLLTLKEASAELTCVAPPLNPLPFLMFLFPLFLNLPLLLDFGFITISGKSFDVAS